MKLAVSIDDFIKQSTSYCQTLKHCADAGFKYINLSIEKFEEYEEQLQSDSWRNGVEKIKNCIDELGLEIVQTHAYGNSNLYAPGADWKDRMQKTIRSIEVSGALGVKNMVMHMQLAPDFTKEKFFEENRKVALYYKPYFEENGVNLLIENGPRKIFKKSRFTKNPEDTEMLWGFYSGQNMREFLDWLNLPFVQACWDTGHANMNGNQYDEIMALGDKLKALHVHDNYGEFDQHFVPFFGNTNFDELMHALIDVKYKGAFAFETGNLFGCETWSTKRREFNCDDRLKDVPIEIRKDMYKILYKIGKHILSSYDCFEE